jgi:pimeloyl-ACP methyl ester carboxylesterase
MSFRESYAAAAARWPAGTTSTEVATSWGRTHLLTAGPAAADVVLLLHGGGATATAWADLAIELAPHVRLLAPDQPGDVGLSSAERPPRSTGDLRAWLTELRAACGVGRWHVVGHSAGAHLALSAALTDPGSIRTLSLLDPTAVVTGFSPRYLASGLPGVLWPDEARTRRPRRRQLAALAVPTLVVVADAGRAHDPDRVARRAAALPGTTVVRLAAATHHTLPLLDAPAVGTALAAHLGVGVP